MIQLSNKLKKADLNLLEKGNNSRYWSNKNLHRNTYRHNKSKFQKIVREYGQYQFHKIKDLMVTEKDMLLKTWCNLPDLQTKVKSENLVQYYPLNSVSNRTIEDNKIKSCEVTNYPKIISNRKGRFLTASDIKYYYQYDTNIYTDLVERFNTRTYKNIDYTKESLEKRFEEIAHRIRAVDFNKRNNDRNNTRRAIDKLNSTPSLFDNMALISDHKKHIAGIY